MKISQRTDSYADLNGNINGAAFLLDNLEGFSVAFTYNGGGGDIEGTFKLQASNNAFLDNPTAPNGGENPDATWVDIDGATISVSGQEGADMLNVSDCYYRAFRIVWTVSGGITGEGRAIIFAKGTY